MTVYELSAYEMSIECCTVKYRSDIVTPICLLGNEPAEGEREGAGGVHRQDGQVRGELQQGHRDTQAPLRPGGHGDQPATEAGTGTYIVELREN